MGVSDNFGYFKNCKCFIPNKFYKENKNNKVKYVMFCVQIIIIIIFFYKFILSIYKEK